MKWSREPSVPGANPRKGPDVVARSLSAMVRGFQSVGCDEYRGSIFTSICFTFAVLAGAFAISAPLHLLIVHAREYFGVASESGGGRLLDPLWKWITGSFGSYVGAAAFPGLLSLGYYFLSALPMAILDLCDFKVRTVNTE